MGVGTGLVGSSLSLGESEDALRSRISRWVLEHSPVDPPTAYEERFDALVRWQEALAAAGFVGLSWPKEYGGAGLDLAAEVVLAEELSKATLPELINRLAIYTWGPTILDHGSEAQKRRFLPGMLDASELWCQGFSEPDAGSDLAAVKTFARRDGNVFRVSGQKVWTSRAERSKWCALLVRTDRAANRHGGLSILIADLASDGVTIRPLRQLLGHPHFSEVFLDEVVVPVEQVLGPIGRGWSVAMAAMGYERGLFVLERQIRLRRRLDDLIDELDAGGRAEQHAEAIGELDAQLQFLQAKVHRTLAQQMEGSLPDGATSVDKLFLAETYQRLFGIALDLLDEEAIVRGGWADDLLESRSVSIYSGTSEIQRTIIAKRLLGLRP